MFRPLTTLLTAFSLVLALAGDCAARGGGGHFGGGGGGFGGGSFHGGDFGGGRSFDAGRSFDGGRGFDSGRGIDGGRDFAGGRSFDDFGRAGSFDRGNLAGRGFDNRGLDNRGIGDHTRLPSDFGFGHAGARSYLPAGHLTHPISQNALQNRGRDVRNNFWHHDWYNHNWWNNHPGAWFAAGWGAGAAWGWTNWGLLGPWYGWNNVQPVYYDYGSNISYQGDQVYYGDAPVATAENYYQQASTLAGSGPVSDGTGDWKPLGVFGLVQGNQTSASAVFQLATDKSGAIAGNFSDMLTGSNQQVHGSVDKSNQRAAWTVGDNKDTVYETGIFNLTKDEAPILVHFGPDRTQQWTLVRLKQPDNAQQAQQPVPMPQ